MIKAFLLTTLLILTACSGGGGGGKDAAPVEDPLFGQWVWLAPGSTSSNESGLVATIQKDGTFISTDYYSYVSGSSLVIYYRKSVGKFTYTSNTIHVTYSYETCDPIGSESIPYAIDPNDRDTAMAKTNSGVIITLKRLPPADKGGLPATMIEDKNCNILAKLEKADKSKRLPANKKGRSALGRLEKKLK